MKLNIRIGFLALALCAGAILLIPSGCNPTIVSPISGKEVTADQLVAEGRRQREAENAKQQAEEEAATRKLREAKKRALIAAGEIKSTADLATADAQRALTRLQVETDADIEAANQDLAGARSRFDAAIAALNENVDQGLASIEAARAERLGIFKSLASLPIVSQGLATAGIPAGGVDGLASILFGSTAAAVASWIAAKAGTKKTIAAKDEQSNDLRAQIKYAADVAYDEGHAAATAQAARQREIEHATWDQSQAEIMKLAGLGRGILASKDAA